MMETITIVTYEEIKARAPETRRAPQVQGITAPTLSELARRCARLMPEGGGMLSGAPDRAVTDTILFDELGSERACATSYAPHRAWCEAEAQRLLALDPPEQRIAEGFFHLHPPGCWFPSGILGYAEGDIAYALAWLTENEAPQACLLYILVNENDGLKLIPWTVSRHAPCEAWYQPLEVGAVEQFGARVYNPLWAAAESSVSRPRALVGARGFPVIEVDLDEVAARTRTTVRFEGGVALFVRPDVAVELTLPEEWSQSGPAVAVVESRGTQALAFGWARQHPERLERRLVRLVRHVLFRVQLERWLGRLAGRLVRRF